MAKKSQFQKGLDKAKALLKPNKNGGKKRRQPGVAGRIGAFLIGVVPAIVPIPGVIANAQNRAQQDWNAGSVIEGGMKEYINGLGSGVGLPDIFQSMTATTKSGARVGSAVGNGNVPKGSTLGIWITGIVYMAMDKAAQVLNSGKGQNIPGTRTRMIGSG